MPHLAAGTNQLTGNYFDLARGIAGLSFRRLTRIQRLQRLESEPHRRVRIGTVAKALNYDEWVVGLQALLPSSMEL